MTVYLLNNKRGIIAVFSTEEEAKQFVKEEEFAKGVKASYISEHNIVMNGEINL